MGLDAILECENHRQAGPKLNNVRSSYHDNSKVEEKDTEERPTSRSYLLRTLDDDFGDLSISPCRKSMPCRPVGVKVEDNEVLKRGSVYQSSKDVSKLKKLREERRKIESTLNDESFLSFEIVNNTPQYCQNEAAVSDEQKRAPLTSLNADLNSSSFDNSHNQAVLTSTTEFLDLSFRLLPEEQPKWKSRSSDAFLSRQSSSDSYLEICLFPDDSESSHTQSVHENVERCLLTESKLRSSETFVPENDNNNHLERDAVHILPKSFSTKVERSNNLRQLESDLRKASQRAIFSPIRKMLDPMKKSKSQRNPQLPKTAACSLTSSNSLSTRRDKTFHKSLLSDLSSIEQKAKHHNQLTDKDQEHHDELIDKDRQTVIASSPAHLHGILKLECKQGIPSFEFSVKDMEDVLFARTWKTNNAFTWVYTFHSGKRNGCSGWGTKDRHRQSLHMVGQMQVSCYFCSELSGNGSLDNSAVTEFILYDISHVKRSSFSYEERYPFPELVQPPRVTLSESLASGDSLDLNDSPVPENCQNSSRASNGDHDSETSTSCPWAPADLLPHLEVAAIVIQIPFGGKKTLKDRLRDDTYNKQRTDFPGISVTDHGRDTTVNPHLVNVKIVTSSGRHGLPCSEGGGPSPLLDRWRSGGGCDCGGWDMTCPITVLDNSGGENATDSGGNHLSLKLFVQGAKDKMPALTITTRDDGQYSVDFHAQFSKLQAFSICVAVLHSLEAFGVVNQEKNGQKLHSNSLKLLLEEEVRHLIEAVAKEEQRKVKRKLQPVSAPYVVDPPFSPMGRV